MHIKPRLNSPYKQSSPFSSSPSKTLSPHNTKSFNTQATRSALHSPRLHQHVFETIEDVIEGVKVFNKEVINEMEIDAVNDYDGENVRISRLVLETLWIHFLGKSFELEDAAGDVDSILEGVKELKNDWSMMIRHYESFRKKVVRRVGRGENDMEEIGGQEVDEDAILNSIDKIVKERDQYEIRVNQLKKEISQLKIESSTSKFKTPLKYQYKQNNHCSPHFDYKQNKNQIIQRIKKLNQQNLELQQSLSSLESIHSQQQKQSPSCDQIKNQLPQPVLLKKQSSQFNASDMFFESDYIQLPKRNQQELIQIHQELGQQMWSKQELLGESLDVLGKAKQIILDYIVNRGSTDSIEEGKNKKSEYVKNKMKSKYIKKVLSQIQKIQSTVSELKSSDNLKQKENARQQRRLSQISNQQKQEEISDVVQSSNQNSSEDFSQVNKQNQARKQRSTSNTELKSKRISKETRFIVLQQQLCKTLDQLSKQKIQNKLMSQKLMLKQNQLAQLQQQYIQVIEQLQSKQQAKQLKTPRNSFKPSQALLAISELIEEPNQTDQDEQIQEQHEIPRTQERIGRRSNKLKSLFECLFPEQQNQKTTIKQIQKLRKQIESYNDNQNSSTVVDGDISPLEMVVLSLQNLLQHLSTLSQADRNNVLISLKDQVTGITDEILSDSQMSASQFQQQVKQIIQKVYQQNETPIRRQIQEFTFYLQGKNSEELLYLIQQFVKRVGKIEFGENCKNSLVNSQRTSQVIDNGNIKQRMTVNTAQ